MPVQSTLPNDDVIGGRSDRSDRLARVRPGQPSPRCVFCVLGMLASVTRINLPSVVERHALAVVIYAIESVAALWFIERLAGFVT
jgi:hypothetical protein